MPRIVDHDQRRGEIILALWQLIARHGIEGVSLRTVAAAAGVSVGRIQHYFGTKEALVRAGCEAMVAGAQDRYEDQTAGEPPLARLRFVLTHAIPDSATIRFGTSLWYAYLAKATDDPAIGALLAETKRGTERECARLIADATAGSGVAVEPTQTARRLLALADGLVLRVLVGDLTATETAALLDTELAALEG